MKQEKSIKSRIKKCHFNILKAYWLIADNPFYDIEKIIAEDASKVRFIYKLELEYNK